MNNSYIKIISEWFSQLSKGYSFPPYSESDLKILEKVLKNHGVQYTKEDLLRINEDEENTRFRGKHASFMEDAASFKEYMLKKYSSGAVINGLEQLYIGIKELDDRALQGVTKIIAKNTKRLPSAGTFDIAKYEKKLYNLIRESITIENGVPSQLFLSIIYAGKVVTTEHIETDIYADVSIEGTNGIMIQTASTLEEIKAGTMSAESVDLLYAILNIHELITDEQPQKKMDRAYLNAILKRVGSEDVINDINSIVGDAQTSEVESIRKLGAEVQNVLGRVPIEQLVPAFLKQLNAEIANKLSSVSFIATTERLKDNIYLDHISGIYQKFKGNLEILPQSIKYIIDTDIIFSGDYLRKKVVK